MVPLKKAHIIAIAFVFAVVIFLSTRPAENPPQLPEGCGLLKIYIINVSQADSILIMTPQNKTILIDAGSKMKPNSSTNAIAFLHQMNISRIDYLIATHYHEDHIGGMPAIFNAFEVGTVYDNGNCGNYSSGVQRDFQLYASSHEFIHVSQDTSLQIDSCLSESTLIAPYAPPGNCFNSNRDTSNENDNSVLLHITYGNTSFLFTGDCEKNCEEELIQKGENLHSDFLKVGHHGSATSSSPQFLSAASASIYAISTDMARSVTDGYFHPRQIPLGNIYARGTNPDNFFRTDLNGNIEIISDGGAVSASADAPSPLCTLFSGYSSSNISSYAPIPALSGRCG
ncbi:MAG: MBL fold metallo-hydrolase [Candidatus ainarchaeum sp.]|nr:MBL fold metallo-hydrolase [Candidatus ainarchaeum sp.]